MQNTFTPPPEIEVFGGGPLDGRSVPARGLELLAVDNAGTWLYLLTIEDDGTKFYRLARQLSSV